MIDHVYESATSRIVMSIAIRKNSTLKPFLTFGVMNLIEQGRRQVEMTRHISAQQYDCDNSQLEVDPLSVFHLVSLFTFLSVSSMISLILLGLEVFAYSRASNTTLPIIQESSSSKLKHAQDLLLQFEQSLNEISYQKQVTFPMALLKQSLNLKTE